MRVRRRGALPFAFAHATAARLLGIPLPYALDEDPHLHIVTRTEANRVRRFEVVGHRGLESREVVEVDGLPVVGPADTWADLGEYVGAGRPVGLDDLIVAGDAAANLLGAIAPLKRAVEARVRPRGKVTLTFALPRIRLGAWSPMETRSRLMVVRAGLPEPRHNLPVFSRTGEWLGFGDLVWEEQRVVGEYQGVEFHTRARDRTHDGLRRDRIARGDWTVVDIVSADVFDHDERAVKLRELAGVLGVNAHLLDVMAAAPQFFAPAQFARTAATAVLVGRTRQLRPLDDGDPPTSASTVGTHERWPFDGGGPTKGGLSTVEERGWMGAANGPGPGWDPARSSGSAVLSRCRAWRR